MKRGLRYETCPRCKNPTIYAELSPLMGNIWRVKCESCELTTEWFDRYEKARKAWEKNLYESKHQD